MKKFPGLLAAGAALALLGGLLTPPPAADAHLVYGPGYTVPEISDPHCTLTPQHPYPVVMIHGTWSSAQKWKYLVPTLRKEGWCVWGLNYGYNPDAYFYKYKEGEYATAELDQSLAEIQAYVQKVLKKTGARKVNIVAHSLGGLLTKLWMHKYSMNKRVGNAVLLTPTLHGTDMRGYGSFGAWSYPLLPDVVAFAMSPAAVFQLYDSPTMKYADSLPDTMPGVNYASIMTKDDQTATPYTTGMIRKPVAPGATAQNVVLQDVCRVDHEMTHSGVVQDPLARPVILRALAARPANCHGTKWEVPDGYVGPSHKGEGNGYAGDPNESDFVIR